jgi:hypothetical protein
MNSTRSALPAFMSDCRIAVFSADASTATRWPGTHDGDAGHTSRSYMVLPA